MAAEMRAIVLSGYRRSAYDYLSLDNFHTELNGVFSVQNVPIPSPKQNQLLIHVKYAPISTQDLEYIAGVGLEEGESRIGRIPGFECTGTIVGASGKGKRVSVRLNPDKTGGTWAEYCVCEQDEVYALRDDLDSDQAAFLSTIPMAALGIYELISAAKYSHVVLTCGASTLSRFLLRLLLRSGFNVLSIVNRIDQIQSVEDAGAQNVALFERELWLLSEAEFAAAFGENFEKEKDEQDAPKERGESEPEQEKKDSEPVKFILRENYIGEMENREKSYKERKREFIDKLSAFIRSPQNTPTSTSKNTSDAKSANKDTKGAAKDAAKEATKDATKDANKDATKDAKQPANGTSPNPIICIDAIGGILTNVLLSQIPRKSIVISVDALDCYEPVDPNDIEKTAELPWGGLGHARSETIVRNSMDYKPPAGAQSGNAAASGERFDPASGQLHYYNVFPLMSYKTHFFWQAKTMLPFNVDEYIGNLRAAASGGRGKKLLSAILKTPWEKKMRKCEDYFLDHLWKVRIQARYSLEEINAALSHYLNYMSDGKVLLSPQRLVSVNQGDAKINTSKGDIEDSDNESIGLPEEYLSKFLSPESPDELIRAEDDCPSPQPLFVNGKLNIGLSRYSSDEDSDSYSSEHHDDEESEKEDEKEEKREGEDAPTSSSSKGKEPKKTSSKKQHKRRDTDDAGIGGVLPAFLLPGKFKVIREAGDSDQESSGYESDSPSKSKKKAMV